MVILKSTIIVQNTRKFKSKKLKAYSLLEVLVSMTIFATIMIGLVSFINLIVVTNIKYIEYTNIYDQTNSLFKLLNDDLVSATKIVDCGQTNNTSCSFKFKESTLNWELIPNPKNNGFYSLRKSVQSASGSTIIYQSSTNLKIKSTNIFELDKILRYDSSISDDILKIELIVETGNLNNSEISDLNREVKILLKNYDKTL